MKTKADKIALYIAIAIAILLQNPVRSYAASPVMKITAFDWGTSYTTPSGDAVLIQSGSSYLLMDTQKNASCNKVIPYLKKNKIRKLDLYLSHWHQDHYANLAKILSDKFFTIRKLYLPPTEWVRKSSISDSKAINKILTAAKKRGTKVIYLHKGSTFKIGKAKASVLWYGSSFSNMSWYSRYANTHSLLTRIEADGIRYLTGGDLIGDTESEILSSKIDVKSDIFKLSHHGKGDSNEFLKAVSPTYTFYMSGEEKKGQSDTSKNDGRTYANKLSSMFGVRKNGNITFLIYPKETKTRIVVKAQRNLTSKKIKGRTVYVSK